MMGQPAETVSQLECLPIEVITVIAEYLTVTDLCVCCQVSSTMRDLFNDNGIWRLRFNTNLEKYLRKTPAKVQPKFGYSEANKSSLSPLPECRISFMRENHLWNNWRQGKYKEEEIVNKDSKGNHYVIFHMFLSNDCVIAQLNDEMEFIDVRETPASDATEKLSFAKEFYESIIYVSEDMLVTALKSSVHIFRVDFVKKQCRLKCAFFFEDSKKMECNCVDDLKKLLNLRKKVQNVGTSIVVGSLFIGSLFGESNIHIWNLETGEKLKEVVCPIKRSSILVVHSSGTMNLVLRVKQANEKTTTFLAFDLKKLEYFPFNQSLEAHSFLVYRDFVAILSNSLLHVFNYKTSSIHIPPLPVSSEPKILKNNILFIHGGMLNRLNLSNKKLKSFPLDGITGFELLSYKFVQVHKNWKSEIWEFDAAITSLRQTSMNLSFCACGFFINKACTRYIVRKEVGNLLNFW